jgi:predicted ATP-dependent serine protease
MDTSEKKTIRINRENKPVISNGPEVMVQFNDLSRDDRRKIIEDAMLSEKEFLQIKAKDDYFIMRPWLKPGTLTVVHANPGIGKTFFCLAIAAAVTRQLPIGKWEVERPVGCVYVDGEMSIGDMQDSLKTITEDLPEGKAPLKLLTSEIIAEKYDLVADLENEKWRDTITDILVKNPEYRILILDNMSSLVPNVESTSTTSLRAINQWQRSLRRKSIAVIAVYHNNKKGDIRGSSIIKDNINYSIALKDLNGSEEDKGACFEVRFGKKRKVRGKEAGSFCMTIEKDPDSGLPWIISNSLGLNRRPYIIGLIGFDIKQRDIAEKLKCTEANVSQIKKKATKEGFFTETGEPTEKWREEYKGFTAEYITWEFTQLYQQVA